MRLDNLFDLIEFVASVSPGAGEGEIVEPEFRGSVVTLHVDVRRLRAVGGAETEGVAAFLEEGGHWL